MAAVMMSKKDKNLIYGCALFAAVAITYMVAISPLNDSITRLTEERDMSASYIDDVQYEASMAEDYASWLDESKAKYLEDRAVFEDVYVTENADRIFTDEVISNEMLPLSFNISERNYDKLLAPFRYEGTDSDLPAYSPYIYFRSITFTCSGTFDKALDFVDKLNKRSGIIITNVSFVNNDGEYSNINSTVNLTVSFDIYTYDKEGFAKNNNMDL